MTPKLLLVMCLLCYAYSVLSGEWRGVEDEGRLCAVPVVNDSNSSNDSYSLENSFCNIDLTGCMEYDNTVTLETEPRSHVGARSPIRVLISPNATVGQEQFFYAFCVSYNSTEHYELVACASNDGDELEIEHRWWKNGEAHVYVSIFSKASFRSSDLLGCNKSSTVVAGNFGLKLDVLVYADAMRDTPLTNSTPSPLPASTPHSHNNSNNTYITGNMTFVPQPDLKVKTDDDFSIYSYFYTYDYGDNSTVENSVDFNITHLFERVGNYSYTVEAIAVNFNDPTMAYHTQHNGTLIVLGPVSKMSIQFNHNNSIIADAKVYLHISCNGSFPITVCWHIQPVSSNNSQPVTSDPGGHVSDIINTCHTLSSTGTASFEMTFSEKGRYKVEAVFSNKVSTVNASYTFQVVAAAKPPIIATTTGAGVVVAVVLAVVVVLIILAVGGYLPYRRYRNRMIETADFRFIDLSERKLSAWRRFSTRVSTLYIQLRSRRNSEKIGLVNLLSASQPLPQQQQQQQQQQQRERELSRGSVSNSYSSSSTSSYYNTV